MSVAFSAEPVPLSRDKNGDIRVGESRVLLDLVVHAFDDGATPETIVQMYPTLKLPDVYAVIAYYLRHRSEVKQYLDARERKAEQIRAKVQSQQVDMQELRQRLIQRRTQQGDSDAASAE
jgi:uncharacterized protein (DUF433 family)